MTPTGVHKERLRPRDFFLLDSKTGEVLTSPDREGLRVSECGPIFCLLLQKRQAGSVMHSHALSAVLAADLVGEEDHLVIEGFEMLKGIRGVSNQDRHFVPVIDNTPLESELRESIEWVLKRTEYRTSYCILVRNHGAYIWGMDPWETKRHAEVYHFLFEGVVSRARLFGKRG